MIQKLGAVAHEFLDKDEIVFLVKDEDDFHTQVVTYDHVCEMIDLIVRQVDNLRPQITEAIETHIEWTYSNNNGILEPEGLMETICQILK